MNDTTANEVAETDLRRVAYDLVVAGVASGLPIPDSIDIPSDNHIFELKMRDNDRESVDAWAAYLRLPKARLGEIIRTARDFRNYEAGTWAYPAMPGWRVEVGSYIDEPKPEDPEKAALRARVAELEARVAEGGAK
ncbi:MAG TPA: hypothetical protein VNS46_06435 [Nocardioides sp.]|nr:hypothetical protein [Nocardioides sp.]